MAIAHDVIEKLSTVLDVKAAKASRASGTSVLAEVVEVDANGVPWVRVLGSESAVPATTRLTTAAKGDLVSMNIRAGKAMLNGNLTSPACTQRDYEYLKQITVTEIANIKEALIDRAIVKELIAGVAAIQTLYAEFAEFEEIVADKIDVEYAHEHYAEIDFANVVGANIQSAKMKELFASSGWFDTITITGDASITGQLKSVLIDGDTARFRNIYADALKLLGPDGLYYALNLAGLSTSEAAELINGYGEDLEEGLHGSRIIAESITATQIDVSTLKAAMLLAQTVQVGATGGIHTEMNGERFSFLAGGYHLPDDMTGVSPTEPLPGEVAFIAVDPESLASVFYIARAVVVKDLRFGNWKWYDRDNGNMALKWIGGNV